MPTIHDENNVDAAVDEKYVESILAPLRRRLSDVPVDNATSTVVHYSTPTNIQQREYAKENGRGNKSSLSMPATTQEILLVCIKSTPNPPEKVEQTLTLKSCLSAQSSRNKRRRSPLASATKNEYLLNQIICNKATTSNTPTSSPIIEPSTKRQKRDLDFSPIPNDKEQIPVTSRKVVQFAPSSAVEYEQEVPVNQSLTPIPAETAVRRYPTEMKTLSNEEYELVKITKQNHAILKAFDDEFDTDGCNTNNRRRRRNKHGRRKSFYIPSTSSRTHDPLFHTI